MITDNSTSCDRPEPPVPADCDLRSFPWLPLPVDMVLTDPWFAAATDAQAMGMIRLMAASWRQIPASSVPDNDAIMRHIAHIRDRKGGLMKAIREEWVLCSDGRLYHPQIAKIALESWAKRASQLRKTEAARAARWPDFGSVTDDQRRGQERRG